MITQGLLQAGAKVYISARNEDACQQAATELSKYGQCIALPADVANPQSRNLLCQSLQEAQPALNILVNNAGPAWVKMKRWRVLPSIYAHEQVPILMAPSFLWMVARRSIINMFQAKQALKFL
jgi:NAD(P)-dependent dehydrogenase (short-subunit alcohol dehydrogenase family)